VELGGADEKKEIGNNMKKLMFAAIAMMCAGTGAQAAVQTYDCTVKSIEQHGWMPDRVQLSFDPETGKARAYDGFIHHAHEKPIDVKFKTVRGKYRMNWRLQLPSRGSGKLRVNYTATLTPGSNELQLKASFPMNNAANLPRGVGRCQEVKGRSLY